VVKANAGKSEGRALRKAAEKEAMLVWQSADSSRQFESKKALRKAYKRHLKATQLCTITMDNEHGEDSDESISESTADKKRTMQATTILNALVTERGLNNEVVTPASAPKTKKKKKKKPPVTASLTEDTGISTQKRPLEPSEVPTSKKARKTFTEELMKEVIKFMAKQPERSASRSESEIEKDAREAECTSSELEKCNASECPTRPNKLKKRSCPSPFAAQNYTRPVNKPVYENLLYL
jgi:hypothetical protein